jgi:hypothetical protein
MSTETERDYERHWAAVRSDPYANAVLDALAEDFPGLSDPIVADVIRKAIYAHARNPGRLEVIVDDPFAARWRLRAAKPDERRVWLACWRTHMTEADWKRHERLNAALDAITVLGMDDDSTEED